MNKHTQELQHNELVDWLNARFGHLRPHAGKLVFLAIALVALGVVFAFYLRARNEVYASQWQRLHLATTEFTRIDGQSRHFTEYADEFPDEPASLWAWQMAANAEMRTGLSLLVTQWDEGQRRLDKAKKLYQRVIDSPLEKSGMLLERANYGLAYCMESLGEFEAAKAHYQKIVTEASESAFASPAKEALKRLDNPNWVNFHNEFYKIGIAPGLVLPHRPDISFPDIDAPPEKAPDGGEADAGKAAGEGDSSGQSDADKATESGQSTESGGDGGAKQSDSEQGDGLAATRLVS